MSAAPAIRLAEVRVDLGGRTVLGPLDLAVPAGEHALLVGPSGSGKTTLLRVLAGFLVPATGTVELSGKPVTRGRRLVVPPERRGIGMIFQGGALWPHMSVRRTIRFALRHSGQPVEDGRVTELVQAVRLEGLEERRPGELSGGEKQRLALARALATRPRILLLDEPLGPLDATLREELLATLARLHAEERWTMLHVTHDPDEARSYADRVLALEGGRLAPESGGAPPVTGAAS